MDIKISDILEPSCILLDVEVKEKTEALKQLVECLAHTGQVRDAKELQRVILEREKLMSTGIGQGVALPHGKTNVVEHSMAALAVLRTPIDFDAIDDKPVSIILMLVGTDANVGMHLRLLSRVSRTVGTEQFRTALLHATSPANVLELFASQEEERA